VQFPQIDLSEHDLPAGDHAIIARIYNESNDYNEYTLPLHIEVPVEVPGIGPIDRVKDIIVPMETHAEGVYSVDHNTGNVIQGWAYLYNRSGQTFSATLHIPENGSTLDIAFEPESPGRNTWRAKLPDLDYPVFDSTLEYSLGGSSPVTIDYPLLEVSEELLFSLSIRDKDGQEPAEIDLAEPYELEGAAESRTPFNRFYLMAGYRSTGGQTREKSFREWGLPEYTSSFSFVQRVSGYELFSIANAHYAIERWLRAKAQNKLGHEVDSESKVDVPPPSSSGRTVAEAVRHYVDEYLSWDLVYGMDSNAHKRDKKRPFRDGKAKLEELAGRWTDDEYKNIPAADKDKGVDGFAGIDCSALVYNVINYVRLERGLPSLDEVLGSDYTNSGYTLKNNDQFPELTEYYKPKAGAAATPDAGNVRIKDLKAGDFMYGKFGEYGHYLLVKEVVDNGDGTYDAVISHSSSKEGTDGKDGPHEYRIDNVSGETGTHEVQEEDVVVGEDRPSANYEKGVLHGMKKVRRDKDLAEEYEKESAGG